MKQNIEVLEILQQIREVSLNLIEFQGESVYVAVRQLELGHSLSKEELEAEFGAPIEPKSEVERRMLEAVLKQKIRITFILTDDEEILKDSRDWLSSIILREEESPGYTFKNSMAIFGPKVEGVENHNKYGTVFNSGTLVSNVLRFQRFLSERETIDIESVDEKKGSTERQSANTNAEVSEGTSIPDLPDAEPTDNNYRIILNPQENIASNVLRKLVPNVASVGSVGAGVIDAVNNYFTEVSPAAFWVFGLSIFVLERLFNAMEDNRKFNQEIIRTKILEIDQYVTLPKKKYNRIKTIIDTPLTTNSSVEMNGHEPGI